MASKFKIIAIFFTLIIISIAGFTIYNWIKHSSFSGIVGSTTFSTLETKKFTIDTPGINPRVYEFDTKSGFHCIALFRDSTDTAPAMQCFKIQKIN